VSPTAELRFVYRKAHWERGVRIEAHRVLQQKWVQHHIPPGHTEAPSEWRDVPTVFERLKSERQNDV
jgi:hypothetical protein